MRDEPEATDEPEKADGPEKTDEIMTIDGYEIVDGIETIDGIEIPPYRSYTWDGEEGAVHIVLYPGEEEADEERKAEFRARGVRMLADLNAEREAEHTPPFPGMPNLRLIHGEGPA
ncbi:hypothetical protein DR950_10810 [Kitasatospora xanthocidica]|uniref:Uncharacterized protein n=1 Tax=Kitasatospora xanthocidica TaxID=83382 RepID=A0A372ZRX8_9ACTN|nr:hypothetical protein [Kitasatospora xanthocidica]RGD58212.1 hypothetical protein DR950_10810 [Kitasatospora xanthocidica]